MQIVVLDSTAIYPHPRLSDGYGRLLLTKADEGSVRLAIPEVVLRESARHYARKVLQAARDFRKASTALVDLGRMPRIERPDDPPSSSKLQDEYLAFIEQLLRNRGQVLPLPRVSHMEILDRLFEERKPFNSDGRGYRDTLIWQSVVDLARSGDAARIDLVTDNVKDFFDTSNQELHPDLAADLKSHGIDPSVIRLHRTIRDLVEAITSRSEQAFALMTQSLKSNSFMEYLATFVDETVSSAIPLELSNILDEEYRLAPFENPYLVGFLVDEIHLEDVRDLGGGSLLVTVGALGEAEMDAFLFKADWYGLDPDDERFTVIDADWNDHYVAVSLSRDASLEITATLVAASSDTVSPVERHFADGQIVELQLVEVEADHAS